VKAQNLFMQYETLAELKAAIDAGIVSVDCVITIDNDSTSMYPEDDDGFSEKIFDGGNPEDLLAEALDLLGIRHEPA